jgi:diguanylate cyclase (GGDEF)-like protein
MNLTRRHTLIGALIGACFPLPALLPALASGADLLGSLRQLHADQPLLYLLYAAPLVLGIYGRALGARQDALLAERAELARRLETAADSLRQAHEETRRVRDHATHLAGHDPVTGVRNRRSIADEASRALKASRRYKRPCAFLLVDVNRLDAVNQAHGTAAGDKYLGIVAAALGRGLRETDTVGRWSNDEFLVLLPETPPEGCAIVVERLVGLATGSPLLLDDYQIRPALSIGVAHYPGHGESPEALVEHARAARVQASRNSM